MTKTEKIALALGATVGMLAGGAMVMRLNAVEAENTRLRVDNINLLRNSLIAIECLVHGDPMPAEVYSDIEFRRLAFLAEYDDIEEEGRG